MKSFSSYLLSPIYYLLAPFRFFGRGPALLLVVVAGCGGGERSYEDGTYRGAFLDSGAMHVNVQFTLRNNVITGISFRYLSDGETDYLQGSGERVETVRAQMNELIEHLRGGDIRTRLADLYAPGDIVATEADGLTGATVRSTKVVSAIRDALNRGVYSY